MLTELRVQGFAIIDELSLSFDSGFVVFTGETGAGKSIIIDAVELLLGGRADSAMVRSGSEAALVEGVFLLEAPVDGDVHKILEREALLDDPKYLTLSREIREKGRNVCRVNGRTVNLALLRELGELLVDVHGQSEHLSLLRVSEHLNLLDRYAQDEVQRASFLNVHQKLLEVRRELDELRQQEQDAERRAEMLAFQVNEIEAAALIAGEEDGLLVERSRLANAEQLALLAEQAIAALDESPQGQESATDKLGQAAHALTGLAKIDGSMEAIQAEAQALVERAGELARKLRIYREEIEFDSARLDEVEERLDLIRGLKRKYGDSIEAVLMHAESAQRDLDTITHAEERIQTLEAEDGQLVRQLGEIGEQLSQMRRQAGDHLQETIASELTELRMPGAQFGVDLKWEDDSEGAVVGERRVGFSADGLDHVEFLVAPNPGEGLKPLVKIASGGETSRLMLGLKSVLAQADRTPTLIFDEIDQGIGGRVGAVVGRKLWGLSRDHQVLCVTHLPQLGAFGDQHYKVEKQVEGGRTITLARPLKDAERIPELASMLGGVTEVNLESAADQLRQAVEAKAQSTTREVEPSVDS
jgi:DNA repair protein RecN (Recombination protein N)